MDLYFWTPGPSRRLGVLQVTGSAIALLPDADPAFAKAFKALAGQPQTLLTRTPSEDGIELRLVEVAPGDPDHWRALVDALGRELGCLLTTTPDPP